MSRPSNDSEVLDNLLAQLVGRGGAAIGLLAAPAAQTSGSITITWSTDDPVYTPDGTITIVDGDAITIAENYNGFEECIAQSNALVVDMAAIRTALAACIADGAQNATAPAALTARAGGMLVFTYTTDDPTISVNVAVTIADGDVVVDEEYHEGIVECVSQLNFCFNDISRLHAAVTQLIVDSSKAPVLGVRTSTNGGVVITYTTDDPVYTPDGSVTVADGDLMTSVNGTSLLEEIINDSDFLGDDFTACKTAYDLYLDAIGRATS